MCVCFGHSMPSLPTTKHPSPTTNPFQPPPKNHTHADAASAASAAAFALHKDVYEVLLYAVEHSTASTNDREKIAKLWRDFFKVGRGGRGDVDA